VKVVFDSNSYVSTLVMPGGVADGAVRAVMHAAVQLFISRPILDEVLEVMSRKFARAPEELARTALYLASLAEIVTPTRRVRVLADEPDNRILECAVAANADVIVTGDRAMLSLGTWEGIEILSLRQFVDRLSPAREARQSRMAYSIPNRRASGKKARATARLGTRHL
jgi:putative PIN family toxin of toxin-antitoxin system